MEILITVPFLSYGVGEALANAVRKELRRLGFVSGEGVPEVFYLHGNPYWSQVEIEVFPGTIPEVLPVPKVLLEQDPSDGTWSARVLNWPGCMTGGATLREAGENLEEAMALWVESVRERFGLKEGWP
jgi:predicted RNase H-like HicB family nuclease